MDGGLAKEETAKWGSLEWIQCSINSASFLIVERTINDRKAEESCWQQNDTEASSRASWKTENTDGAKSHTPFLVLWRVLCHEKFAQQALGRYVGKSLERGIEKKRWLLDFLIPLPICGQVSDRDGQNGRMVRTCCASCYLEGKRFSSGGARGWKLLPLLFEVAWKWLISSLACGWGKLLFTTFPRAGRKGGGSSGSEWPHLHALSWKVMRIRRGKLKITSQKQANKPTCKHRPPIVEREWEYKGENSKQTSICSSINVTIITTILIVLHMPSGLHLQSTGYII